MTRRARRLGGVCLGLMIFATACGANVQLIQSSLNDTALDRATFGMRTNGGFFDLTEFERTETWLGVPIEYTVQFTGRRSPESMNSAAFGLLASDTATLPDVADRVTLALTVSLAFGTANGRSEAGQTEVRAQLEATAAGEHDDAYGRVARRLVEAGHGDAIVRFSQEFNGLWAPWSAIGNEDAFIAAWRHVHGVFREVSQDFRFDWSAMRADWVNTAPAAWPGDDFVDIVGLDLYWRNERPEWDQQRWETEYLVNLIDHQAFAAERDKPVSYPEWGLNGVDEPRFVEEMHRWLTSLPEAGAGSLAYHAFFDGGEGYALANYPESEARFRELFGSL